MNNRIKKIIQDLAFLTFVVIVFLVTSNIVLGIYYSAKNVWRVWKYTQAHGGRPTGKGAPFFYADGSPVVSSKRLDYQLTWFNYNYYTGADPAYVSEVLDDFYALAMKGLTFQPWTEHSESFYNGKRVHVDRDEL